MSKLLGAWVSPEVKELVAKLSEAKGVSLSEYVRQLILKDLDSRTFFTDKVKNGEHIAPERVIND